MAGKAVIGAQLELPAGLVNKVSAVLLHSLLGVLYHTPWLTDRTFNQNPPQNGENGCPSIPVILFQGVGI